VVAMTKSARIWILNWGHAFRGFRNFSFNLLSRIDPIIAIITPTFCLSHWLQCIRITFVMAHAYNMVIKGHLWEKIGGWVRKWSTNCQYQSRLLVPWPPTPDYGTILWPNRDQIVVSSTVSSDLIKEMHPLKFTTSPKLE